MTFREAMEHYRSGTATEEERQLVEQELEKNQLIAEFLDEQWDEKFPVPTAPIEEMRQVRKTLRRRNVMIVLTSLVLAAVLLLGTIYIGIPTAERLYWDPDTTSYGRATSTDLELMLAVYAELFCPDMTIISATSDRIGFARYDISIQYWNLFRGGDNLFASATIEKGVLDIPDGVLRSCPVNTFDRATYPFDRSSENPKEELAELKVTLEQLPEYISLAAAVSFPEDKSMAELLEFQSSLQDGSIGWAGIRSSPLDEQMIPLFGMQINSSGSVRREANEYYPCLDIKGMETTAENLETHFKSLLQFSADQVQAGRGIDVHGNYTSVLEYVEENGIYSYGCFVYGSPETFLALIESGAVSQVLIEDIRISV